MSIMEKILKDFHCESEYELLELIGIKMFSELKEIVFILENMLLSIDTYIKVANL